MLRGELVRGQPGAGKPFDVQTLGDLLHAPYPSGLLPEAFGTRPLLAASDVDASVAGQSEACWREGCVAALHCGVLGVEQGAQVDVGV